VSDQQPPTGPYPGQQPGSAYGPPPGSGPGGPPPGGPPAGPPAGPPPGGYGPPPGGYGPPPGFGGPAAGGPGGSGGAPKKGKKGLAVGAGVAAAVLLIGGGAFAGVKLLGGASESAASGAAEVLPETTFALAGVDLSEEQLQEAAKVALKFPAITDELDISGDGDIRQQIIDKIIEDAGSDCELADSDFDWVGDQAAFAGVVVDDRPAPAAAVQSTDKGAAEAAFAKFDECAGGEKTPYAFSGDWVILGPEQEAVDAVVSDAEQGTLADNSDFDSWMGKVGDPGIFTMYASPEAGAHLAEFMGEASGMGGDLAPMPPSEFNPFAEICPGLADPSAGAEAAAAQYEKFAGAAGTVRVTDGGLEMEFAADMGTEPVTGESAGALVETLPADTGGALGVSLKEGWYDAATSSLSTVCGEDFSADDLNSMLSEATGLDVPADVETLAGDALALSVGSGMTADVSSPEDIKAGLKIQGDAAAIEGVVDDIRSAIESNGGSDMGFLDTSTEGDYAAVGPSSGYRDELLADGGLGDDETFQNVVPDADKAGFIMFVNFNQLDSLVEETGDDEATENFKPLDGLGVSGWTEGTEQHAFVRLSTDS